MAVAGVGKRLEVSDEDRVELERIVRAASSEVRMVERARIVLSAAEGLTAAAIAARVGCAEKTAKKWRGRYARSGIEGLKDASRPGPPLTHGPQTRALLIAKACTRPPATPEGARQERWTYKQLGAAVGMSGSQAHVILARADIKPHLTEYWIMSDFSRPEFEERLSEICGLYVDPPANVLVVSIDEKTAIQAKAPTKPDRPPEPGKPARREHEYTRNGTQCLFAALKVHHGDVLAMASKTRNRFDLIRFLEHLDAHPGPRGPADRCDHRQPLHAWHAGGPRLARGAPALELSVHPDPRELAQSDRDLLLDPLAAPAQARHLHQRRRPRAADARLHRDLQPDRHAVLMDLHRQGARSMRARISRMNH
jgi:transposase